MDHQLVSRNSPGSDRRITHLDTSRAWSQPPPSNYTYRASLVSALPRFSCLLQLLYQPRSSHVGISPNLRYSIWSNRFRGLCAQSSHPGDIQTSIVILLKLTTFNKWVYQVVGNHEWQQGHIDLWSSHFRRYLALARSLFYLLAYLTAHHFM